MLLKNPPIGSVIFSTLILMACDTNSTSVTVPENQPEQAIKVTRDNNGAFVALNSNRP